MFEIAPGGVRGILGSCAEGALMSQFLRCLWNKYVYNSPVLNKSAQVIPAQICRQKSMFGTFGLSLMTGLSMPHSVSWYFLRQKKVKVSPAKEWCLMYCECKVWMLAVSKSQNNFINWLIIVSISLSISSCLDRYVKVLDQLKRLRVP